MLFTDRYADRGLVEAVAFPANVERVDQAATTKAQVQIVSNGVTAPLVRITKTEARQRWDANDYVAVTNDRYDDGHPGFAMLPSAMLQDFPTFDAMAAASIDGRRPSALHFSKPDPARLDGNAVALEAKRVVRQFQRYTSEQRADRAASHRLGHRQKTALGEHFYTHPGLPGVAFDSRKRAAETAHRKLGQQPTPGVRVVSGPHEPSPTVRHCDVGGEALPGDARWWLVTAPDRGWEAHHGASCATHIGKADAAPAENPTQRSPHGHPAAEQAADDEPDPRKQPADQPALHLPAKS
ncbi:hypothetical protein [Micromonospora sp. NPDC051141]|uniref:hypothetical protein n=1 Tax=Micromonospora sp. NPDC051141 TaxID=3364284 RepID=UPI0037BCAF94